MSAGAHTHPELEDRISAEISGIHTELLALRADTRRSLTAIVQALAVQGETLRQHGDLLGQILARLDEKGPGS